MNRSRYAFYQNKKDYPNTPKSERDLLISQGDVSKFAIRNGSVNGAKLSYNAKEFYSNICKMALEKVGPFYVKSDAYINAEVTYKGSISFALGMLAAQLVANKVYGIRRLYHLNDKRLYWKPNTGRHPDFFGVDNGGNAFLFEAKGSNNENINASIDYAEAQLKNVISVTDLVTHKVYSSLNRRIIGSAFKNYGSINSAWHIQEVDPVWEGEKSIVMDFDKACFLYYKDFVDYFDSLECTRSELKIGNSVFYSFTMQEERYCICKSIYDEVKARSKQENELWGFESSVDKVLDDLFIGSADMDCSSLEDGIIVCGSDSVF